MSAQIAIQRLSSAKRGRGSDPGRADEVVRNGTDRESNKWEQDGSENVIPACACHLSCTQENFSHQELERNEWNVEHGRCNSSLDSLNIDMAETSAAEFSGEGIDLAEVVDHPAVA